MATVQRPVVVDTNILFSALLSRKSDFAEGWVISTAQ